MLPNTVEPNTYHKALSVRQKVQNVDDNLYVMAPATGKFHKFKEKRFKDSFVMLYLEDDVVVSAPYHVEVRALDQEYV